MPLHYIVKLFLTRKLQYSSIYISGLCLDYQCHRAIILTAGVWAWLHSTVISGGAGRECWMLSSCEALLCMASDCHRNKVHGTTTATGYNHSDGWMNVCYSAVTHGPLNLLNVWINPSMGKPIYLLQHRSKVGGHFDLTNIMPHSIRLGLSGVLNANQLISLRRSLIHCVPIKSEPLECHQQLC